MRYFIVYYSTKQSRGRIFATTNDGLIPNLVNIEQGLDLQHGGGTIVTGYNEITEADYNKQK